MFGREAQLRELEHALAQARGGAGRLVFVSGEAGVGKTRLAQELAARAGPEVDVLRGNCFDEDPAEPYAPFRDVLRALAQANGPAALAEAAGPWATELARLLPDVAAPAPAGDDPQSEKRRLFEAIYRVLRPAADQPCRVVLFEDLHWSDQTSQELIAFLARAVERDRLLLLGTYRADELHRRHPLSHLIARLARERLYHELRLAPLTPAEFARMLEATLGRGELPAGFVEALYERTEGNPFFAEEVLGSLVEHGRLDALLQAAHERRRIDVPEIPLSVRDSILRRASDLEPLTASVLRHAAVIGRRFDFDLLAQLTRLSEPELLRALAELVERQLVLEDEACPEEDRYRFRHELVREAVLEDMLRRERRTMHREVLRALEELHGEAPERVVDQLAYHSLQARDMERAARFARMAGDRAVGLSAYREALAHYEVALELADSADDAGRAELLERLGHAAYPLGDVRRCAEYWREAQALYAALGERRKAADVLRWLGRAAWELDDQETAFAHTRAALAALEGEPPCHELAMAHSALSHLYMLTGQQQESIAWGQRALALAEQIGDRAVTAHALNNIGTALCELGEHERGTAALEQSLELARAGGLHLNAVRAYINLGGQLSHTGDLRRALELHREAAAYAERVGFDLRVAVLLPKLAGLEMMVGEWQQAHARIDQALRAAALGAPLDRDYVLMVRADILLRQGRTREAVELIEALRPPAPVPGNCWDALNAAHLQALAYAALGDHSRAAAAVAEGVRVWNIGGRPRKAFRQLTDALEILVAARHTQEARTLLATAEGMLADDTLTAVERAILADSRGVVLAAAANPGAEPQLRAAAELWQSMGLPFEEACSRRRLADLLLHIGAPGSREAARAELEAAGALLEPLGAATELARLAAMRRQLTMRRQPAREEPARLAEAPALTPREREVLALLARGASNRAIAETLVISEKTVEVHVSNILGKLGATSRTHAAALARDQGIDVAAA
jgi:DNA-binding CsgD family transcriptional regulator/Tfp pilus assembly protein PilF